MRFLHTADWHLGMTRRFLPAEAQARYGDDRIQAVRDMAALADREGCEFVVACGDLFDSNHVDRQVIARALDALSEFTVPVFMLPGNHDPLDAASVYRSPLFADRVPVGVTVIEGPGPIDVAPGVQVVGAPWHTRRPPADPAASVLAGLAPAAGVTRVLAAHGAVDVLSPDAADPALMRLDDLRHALFSGAVSYVALGDRHSACEVGDDPRIRYPGSPVATDMGEVNPGTALVVHLTPAGCEVTEHRIGRWSFMRIEARLNGLHDVERLDADLGAIHDRARAVVRLSLVGTLGVDEDSRLREVLDHHGDVLASLTVSEGRSDLALVVDDDALAALGLQGYAHDAAADLARAAAADGPDREAARDALRLLYRLARAS